MAGVPGRRVVLAVEELLQLPADHEPHHRLMADFLPLERPGVAAVTQHCHAVGNLLNFPEPMRDVENADSVPPQVAHDAEEPLRLARR